MLDLWYKNAVLYCLDVETYMDGNDDGIGDFEGLTQRLDYLAGLGITCIYDRGIRRRFPPMVDGDSRRLRLAYSLVLTLPGTSVLFYGEEIGMGDDLSQKERNSIRPPMQWSGEPNAGFSKASYLRRLATSGSSTIN